MRRLGGKSSVCRRASWLAEDVEQTASSQSIPHPSRAQRDQRGALQEANSYFGSCLAFPSALH